MISNIKFLIQSKFGLKKKSTKFSNSLEYWESRAKKFGRLAVINVDHTNNEFEEIKNRDKNILFPLLQKQLTGKEKLILDFGCGSGRFTADLAELIGQEAVGADPTANLIKLAPKDARVKYIVIKDGRIPLPDESVDVIWIYAVLGCIKDESMPSTVFELQRVLKKGGVLFMTENTTSAPDSTFYTYRTYEKYMKLISFASMRHLHDYYDVGKNFEEKFSVMAGRKIF